MGNREVWRLLELSVEEPALNLAIDEALIRSKSSGSSLPTLRLWRNPRCIVIGVSQNPFQEVNLGECEALGLPVVRRQSGGGAVYHDEGNLNYSLIVGHGALRGNTSTERSYSFFLSGVSSALSTFGLVGELRNISDIYVQERKIAGCAQYRTSQAILHHGCLLVRARLEVLERTLRVPLAWYREVVNLAELVQPEPEIIRVGEALADAYAELFGIELQRGELSDEEWCQAKSLYEEKYKNPDWNLRIPAGWRPGRYGPRAARS